MPQACGHPALRATGTQFLWKRVPRPPRIFLGAALSGQNGPKGACRETQMFTARSAGRNGAGGSRAVPQAFGHPALRATGTQFLWKRVPRPPRVFLGAARKRANLPLAGLPRMGSGEGERMGGGRGGRNHRSQLPGRETNSSATSDRWKVRGSTLPGRGVGDARTETRLFNIM